MDIHRKPLRRKNDPDPCTDPACDGGLCTVCNGWGYQSIWKTVEPRDAEDAYLDQWRGNNFASGKCPHGCPPPKVALSAGPVYEYEVPDSSRR